MLNSLFECSHTQYTYIYFGFAIRQHASSLQDHKWLLQKDWSRNSWMHASRADAKHCIQFNQFSITSLWTEQNTTKKIIFRLIFSFLSSIFVHEWYWFQKNQLNFPFGCLQILLLINRFAPELTHMKENTWSNVKSYEVHQDEMKSVQNEHGYGYLAHDWKKAFP